MHPDRINRLNPYYILGIVDGEGWFGVSISKKEELSAGHQISLNFGIAMNCRDTRLITKIYDYFKCGIVTIKKNGMTEYRVRSFGDMVNIIIPFFDKYKLQSEKKKDFEYMKIIATMMGNGEHFTTSGIDSIRNIQRNLHVYSEYIEEKL